MKEQLSTIGSTTGTNWWIFSWGTAAIAEHGTSYHCDAKYFCIEIGPLVLQINWFP